MLHLGTHGYTYKYLAILVGVNKLECLTLATFFHAHLIFAGKVNGTARFEKCKQLFEYQHLRLLRDI
jgi:hypothetical protein